MFVIFVNFAICVFISSCGTYTLRTEIPDDEKLVEKELAPIRVNLEKIMHHIKSIKLKYDGGIRSGQIQGSVKKIIERALTAEKKNEELLKKEAEMQVVNKMLRILGVRSRVETLVDELYPGRRPYHVTVAKGYEEILTSKKPEFKNRSCIIVFRNRVSSYGISNEDFLDGIRAIYSSFSDKAAHKVAGFEPSPPKYNDQKGIEEMFESFGITADKGKIITAQIILEPLPLLSTKSTTS